MASPLEDALDRAVAEAERLGAAAEELRAGMAAVTAEATSRDRCLTVTVGAAGELAAVAFHGDAYRALAPAELADVLVETARRARDLGRTRVEECARRLWPAEVSPLGIDVLAGGSGELGAMLASVTREAGEGDRGR